MITDTLNFKMELEEISAKSFSPNRDFANLCGIVEFVGE